jgi:stearoyl-CoA desaturase (delta-9 desaturase)
VQGTIKEWALLHRAHHRYTDTDIDPHDARKGLLWRHIGWVLVKHRDVNDSLILPTPIASVDIKDLMTNDVVIFQSRYYWVCALVTGVLIPAGIPWLCWGDGRGGLIYGVAIRLFVTHHVS